MPCSSGSRSVVGRSPRERGSRIRTVGAPGPSGSIPAGAGEPCSHRRRSCPRRVDPRGSGGANRRCKISGFLSGRSPRERGSPAELHGPGMTSGSIPAGAGEPANRLPRSHLRRVDPRGSGGASKVEWIIASVTGRSPRERGSRRWPARSPRRSGSIPAGAGEPSDVSQHGDYRRVDPRGSGGARCGGGWRGCSWGRSPRERGSLADDQPDLIDLGSIPAGAGEPSGGRTALNLSRVDPRGSGGATSLLDNTIGSQGRSPRERGSLGLHIGNRAIGGSIPAGAGEPPVPDRAAQSHKVDPRGSGGAAPLPNHAEFCLGRSPRERGSHHVRSNGRENRGSIPAGAGEPHSGNVSSMADRVDPRGSGGAIVVVVAVEMEPGRSPRERGSHRSRGGGGNGTGSIPAGAGEPASRGSARWWRWVDPRGSGGAARFVMTRWPRNGRSPRERGSQEAGAIIASPVGSIPAGAGEPAARRTIPQPPRVNPRGSGGATYTDATGAQTVGRSPRERGSPKTAAQSSR